MNDIKHIDLATANKMLSLVRPIATQIDRQWHTAKSCKDKIDRIFLSSNRHHEVLIETITLFKKAMKSIDKAITELEDLGCRIESVDQLVIDFPSKISGKRVMLCWKLGEKEITHYHKYTTTFEQRQPLNEQSNR